MATARYEAEKFSGKNDFGLWQIKMRALLIQQGLEEAIEPIDTKEKGKEVDDPKVAAKKVEMAKKAHSAIVLNLTDKVLREVSKETTAQGVWAKLESLYLTKSLANRLYMKQRLYSYKILEDKSFIEQVDDFNKTLDDLENVDGPIKNEDKAILLLNALPKSYHYLKDAMLYGRTSTAGITFEEVQCALRSKELEKSSYGPQESSSQALNVNKFKGKRKKSNLPFKPQNQKKETVGKETRSCHYCKKPGHLKKDCYSWKKKQGEENGQVQNQADLVEGAETPHALNIAVGGIENSWIVDSGCSFHICSRRGWFQDLSSSHGSVLLGNDQPCAVKGIGSIKLKLHDGSVRLLTQVRFIPEIKRNLISLGMLESKGYKFTFENGFMVVSIKGQEIMMAERQNSLYYLVAETLVDSCNSVVKDDIEVWHKRLGHIGEAGIRELIKGKVIPVDASQKLQKCEYCVLGKSKKLPYKAGIHTSKAVLEYAHCDLWGPAQPATIGGGRYFMSIIDDY